MTYDPETAAIRFGTGLGPMAPPADAGAVLAMLSGSDDGARDFPIIPFSTHGPDLAEFRRLRRIRKQDRTSAEGREAQQGIARLRRAARRAQAENLSATLLRGATAPHGFRDRLTWFWADHFAVRGKGALLRYLSTSYVEEAIRPNVAGRFADLLKAAVLHPVMLLYLDQVKSVGPNSPLAGGRRGLNENLAREVLELHSLGVTGTYTQNDVRELAELFAGLSYSPSGGFAFRARAAEPGEETVLGQTYGGDEPRLDDVLAFLDDLAVHPDTAHHIAQKLVVHFVSDTPDAVLVDHVAAAYRASDGRLDAAYGALLEHPAAWAMPDHKVRQPLDFLAAALRVLAVDPARLKGAEPRDVLLYLGGPMALMGQHWETPEGPDGWPEEAAAWITPQGVAARIQWAMTVPRVLRPDLPDPRDLIISALGARASEPLRFAANSAATKWEGVGLILSAPEFQKR